VQVGSCGAFAPCQFVIESVVEDAEAKRRIFDELEAAAALARAIGKEPSLVEKDVPAFIVNRLGYAMYREALNKYFPLEQDGP